MRTFPVKKLTADLIELGGQALVSENGDLLYNGNIIARYEDLLDIYVVSSQIDMNFLNPKFGDIVKRTDTGMSFIWSGVWIGISRTALKVYTVSSQDDLVFLSPIAGDIANITDVYQSSIYDGENWNTILTGVVGSIDDDVISVGTTYSSYKINYLIHNHDHDGGEYN